MKEKKTHSKAPLLGKILMKFPTKTPIFYPMWLRKQLTQQQHTWTIPTLPNCFDGLTIAYVSDIHYGTYLGKNEVFQLVEKVNALGADFIILGGDYAENYEGALEFFSFAPKFSPKIATLGVMGNHDSPVHHGDHTPLLEAMKRLGIIPLVNQTYHHEKEGKTLSFSAPGDYYHGVSDITALKQQTSSADTTVFLPHTPDVFYQMEDCFFDLALCGHTHGGQVALFGKILHTSTVHPCPYQSGEYSFKGAKVLVSNGVGTSFLPVRFGVKPQFHHITLCSNQ